MTEIKSGDAVRIIDGKYAGLNGIVSDHIRGTTWYYVVIVDKGSVFTENIPRESLHKYVELASDNS